MKRPAYVTVFFHRGGAHVSGAAPGANVLLRAFDKANVLAARDWAAKVGAVFGCEVRELNSSRTVSGFAERASHSEGAA